MQDKWITKWSRITNQATNYGLINFSSSSVSDLSPLEIIEILGFVILCILFCRWIWKFYTKQREKKQVRERRQLENLVRPAVPVPLAMAPSMAMAGQPAMATGSGNNRYMQSIEMLPMDQSARISEISTNKEPSVMDKYCWEFWNLIGIMDTTTQLAWTYAENMIKNMEWIWINVILIWQFTFLYFVITLSWKYTQCYY